MWAVFLGFFTGFVLDICVSSMSLQTQMDQCGNMMNFFFPYEIKQQPSIRFYAKYLRK